MKNKKNLDEFVKVRLTKEEKLCLKAIAFKARMSESEYVRFLIDSATLEIRQQIKKGDLSYEDIETVFDNMLLQRRVSQRQARNFGK